MKRVKIAVNTRLLLKDKLEGIGWFTYESLKRICSQHPEVDFYFIFDRKPDPIFLFSENITPVVVSPQARHPFLFYLWFNITVPLTLKKIRPDLFLSPDGYNSLPFKGKSLLVIHDLNYEHYPKDVPWLVRKYLHYYSQRFAHKADRIATVSEFSKKDICCLYGISPANIDVVFDGVNESYRPLDEHVKKQVKEKYTGGKPYFIFLGALHPRKNLVNLFKAFDLFRQNDTQNTKLVIAGAKTYWTNEIKEAYSSMKFIDDVLFTNRLESKEVNEIIGAALGMVYVSYFEGFGIPILEAFACSTPVITSNQSSMPEIAGDAALIVNPFSSEDIAEAMHRLSVSDSLREELIQKGKIRMQNYSWNKTAQLLWESIERTLNL